MASEGVWFNRLAMNRTIGTKILPEHAIFPRLRGVPSNGTPLFLWRHMGHLVHAIRAWKVGACGRSLRRWCRGDQLSIYDRSQGLKSDSSARSNGASRYIYVF